MSLTPRDHAIAYHAGRAARRAGKKVKDCPPYDNTLRGDAQVEAWVDGFNDEDRERAALVAAGWRVPA